MVLGKVRTDDPRFETQAVLPSQQGIDIGSPTRPFGTIYADDVDFDTTLLNDQFLRADLFGSAGQVGILKLSLLNNTVLNALDGRKISLRVNDVEIGSADVEAFTYPAFNLPDGEDKNYSIAAYAAGTGYNLTTTPAAIDFGGIDPVLGLDHAGSYLILARVKLNYTGANFPVSRVVTIKLRRTNNTPADIINGTSTFRTTSGGGISNATACVMDLQPVLYSTSNLNDSLTLFGDVSVLPTAGALTVTEASIVAIRLK